jgi:thiol-disulfide isomerase/thioredoxin
MDQYLSRGYSSGFAALGLIAALCACTPQAGNQSAKQSQSPAGEERVDPERLAAYEAQMRRDQSEHPTLSVGAAAPDFALMGTDGKTHSLSDYQASPALIVVFISNHCPASQLYEGRIKGIVTDYASKGVQVIAIAPNGPQAVGPAALNYSDVDDSFDSMKIRANFRKFNFPYLYDGETQSVSAKYGPKVTPHLFIFDADRKLRYEGRIDDRLQEAKVTVRDARNALDQMLAGKPVSVAHTPVFGCSTKWNSHADSAQSEVKDWLAQPVSVKSASLSDLQTLRKNPGGKTLMVNFWATWCAPCQTEYPQLLESYLWYRTRDFDFVSVSVDVPADRPKVERFLNKTHSAIDNRQVDTDDVYAVMKSFDPAWESGVPFTMVIAPGGQVIYSHQGEVDKLELRRAILGNLPDAGMFAGNTSYWRQ